MNVRRRGFTLIEILITIGIIMVLIGIAAYGLSRVSMTSKINATRVTLGNLKSMVAELDAAAGLKGRQPAQWAWTADGMRQTVPTPPAGQTINVWLDADPSTVTTPPGTTPPEPLLVPAGPVTSEFSANGGIRYKSDAVVNTQLIMQQLLSVPRNKEALSQIPAEQRMETLPGGFAHGANEGITFGTDRKPTTPIVLDAWQNPIIFVPGSGLCGNDNTTADDAMWIGGERTNPVPADLKFVKVQQSGTNTVPPIQAPDRRPFWASAGPDGDFRTADDNLYSFEN